jgi:hypothetical protein
VLTVLSLAARDDFDAEKLRDLRRRAEAIARGRGSHVLGVRHLVLAMTRLGLLDHLVAGGTWRMKEPGDAGEGVDHAE